MATGLNNVATTDSYSETNTVRTGECQRVNIDVSQAGIFYQLQMASGYGRAPVTDAWLPERFIGCAANISVFKSLSRRCTGIRIRSAVIGVPARVTLELLDASEIGKD